MRNHTGFTLIEVVVTIIVSSILAVLLMQVMKGHSARSHWPLEKINQGLALREVMEKISADYRSMLISEAQPLVALQTHISSADYWSGQTYSAFIQVLENKCLGDIRRDDLSPPGEETSPTGDICSQTDTLLKVTLAYDSQSLTAVFSR